jgi:hypothetical protein
MNTEIPLIESAMIQSPYSGCRWFSGWPKAPYVAMPGGAVWPPQRNAPGASLCVDRYRPGWTERRVFKRALAPGQLAPSPIQRMGPAYRLRVIKGPSATGPWTFIGSGGEFWGRGPLLAIGGIGAQGNNLGLT